MAFLAGFGKKLDRHAFGRAYDLYFKRIFNYILARTGSVADAEDLTAQTFTQALKSFTKIQDQEDKIEPWLYRIATNEVNQFYRRNGVRGKYTVAMPDEALQDVQDRETQAVETTMQKDELFQQLAAALHTLSPDDQTLIVLRYFENLSYSKIAMVLGKREGALTMRCTRALDKLKATLENRGFNHERTIRTFTGSQAEYGSSSLSTPPAS